MGCLLLMTVTVGMCDCVCVCCDDGWLWGYLLLMTVQRVCVTTNGCVVFWVFADSPYSDDGWVQCLPVCVCLLRPYSGQCNERWLQCLPVCVCACYDRTVGNVTKGGCRLNTAATFRYIAHCTVVTSTHIHVYPCVCVCVLVTTVEWAM